MNKVLDIDKKLKEFMVIDQVNPGGSARFGHQWVFRFPNGYGASLVSGGFGVYGEYEMAVLKYNGKKDTDFSLIYSTPITDDVLGYLTLKDVEKYLGEISNLPSVKKGRKN